MNRTIIAKIATVATLLAAGAAAQAETFQFTYSDSARSAVGSLTASSNGDGSFTAFLGTVSVTDNAPGSTTHTYPLIANPNGTSPAYSPSGGFIYDNQVFTAGDPLIDYWGLMFRDSTTGFEVNIWGNGPGNQYQLQDSAGNTTGANGSFTLTAVPAPAASVAGLGGLAGIASVRRRRSI